MNAHAINRRRRGGAASVLAVAMTVIVGSAALAIDIGRLYVARTELQSSADAAALAGAVMLLEDQRLKGVAEMNELIQGTRAQAAQYAFLNTVLGENPFVDLNPQNDLSGDIVVGHIRSPGDQSSPMTFDDPFQFNAVQVCVRRDQERNGSISLVFARIFGYDSWDVSARATAAFTMGTAGFRTPPSGRNVGLLPFALKDDAWAALLANGPNENNDHFTYDSVSGQVFDGPDGIPELNLYPGSAAGQLPPGNFGTVDIGAPGNSTADISRQIREGVSAEDLAWLGGELRLGPDGTLLLNGDTGLSAAVKDDLVAIIGEGRTIPLFASVSGPGNNAWFVVNGFAGIRVLEVRLTGPMSQKRVIVQPAVVIDEGAISDANLVDYNVYRPVLICR